MLEQFAWLGGIVILLGLVFVIWPRVVEEATRSLFTFMSGNERPATNVSTSARAAGIILLLVGCFFVLYGVLYRG